MTSFLAFAHRSALGAALLLTFTLWGCTEDTKNPTYAQPVITDTANGEARDFDAYTQLKWSDEFNDGALDQRKWTYEISDNWFNNELQATTSSPDNIYLSTGTLVIQAQQQTLRSRNYTSARIVTRDKKSFNYGRVDIRAKLPTGKGIWPAIWMLGTNEGSAGWPACGEIDIAEIRGSQPNKLVSTVHFGNSVPEHAEKGLTYALPAGNFSDDFHVFSVIRSENQVRWFLDGAPYFAVSNGTVSPYPFNNPFYMILNVAVGGLFDGDPDGSTTFPKQMLVDYVRYYQYE